MARNLPQDLEELERARRRAGRRTAIAVATVVVLGSTTGAYYLWRGAQAYRVAETRVQETTTAYERTKQELTRVLFGEVRGIRRQALEEAYRLYEQKIPFTNGGKTPGKGFDTSGFVAYILNRAGVLDNPETYHSRRLRETFKPDTITPADVRPGDLIFEANNACWLALANGFAIGMVPGGIQIGQVSSFTAPVAAYGRVTYPDERK